MSLRARRGGRLLPSAPPGLWEAMVLAAVAVAAAAAGCHQRPPRSAAAMTDADGGAGATGRQLGMAYGLLGLQPPPGPDPAPAAFAAARAELDRGWTAYQDRRAYREAAEHFMNAAAMLKPSSAEPNADAVADALARDRLAAYSDAAWSWDMAGARPEGRRRLEAAAAADPACARELREMIAKYLGP